MATSGIIFPNCQHRYHVDCLQLEHNTQSMYNPCAEMICPECDLERLAETVHDMVVAADENEKAVDALFQDEDGDEVPGRGVWVFLQLAKGWTGRALLEGVEDDERQFVRYFHLHSPNGDLAICKFKPFAFGGNKSDSHAKRNTISDAELALHTLASLPQFELLYGAEDNNADAISRCSPNAVQDTNEVSIRFFNGMAVVAAGKLLDRTPYAPENMVRRETIENALLSLPPFQIEWPVRYTGGKTPVEHPLEMDQTLGVMEEREPMVMC